MATLENRRMDATDDLNMGATERQAMMLGGGALTLTGIYELARGRVYGALLAAAGGAFAYMGARGHSPFYDQLGINRAELGLSDQVSVPHRQGIKVQKAVTINRPASDLYAFWRNFEHLPQFMKHVKSIQVQDDLNSHWEVTAPAGRTVGWDAEIINDVQGQVIGWRSLEGADIPNAGSVTFREAPNGRGTEVHVTLEYAPPGLKLGAAIAKLFIEEPNQQVEGDLRRFKELMETGEVPSVEGQPHGRRTPW